MSASVRVRPRPSASAEYIKPLSCSQFIQNVDIYLAKFLEFFVKSPKRGGPVNKGYVWCWLSVKFHGGGPDTIWCIIGWLWGLVVGGGGGGALYELVEDIYFIL